MFSLLMLLFAVYCPTICGATFKVGGESLYISEGRDNFVDEPVAHLALDIKINTILISFLHTQSTESSSGESSAILGKQWGLAKNTSLNLYYSYLRFTEPEGDDHEVTAELTAGYDAGPSAILSTVFSHQSSGFCTTAELTYTIQFEGTNVSPFVTVGLNSDYIPNEHSGFDHYVVGIRASRAMPAVTVNAHVSKTTPINEESRDSLVSQYWAGMNLSIAF